MSVKRFLLSELEELPIPEVSGFCGRAELQLSEDCKKKIQIQNDYINLTPIVWSNFTRTQKFTDIQIKWELNVEMSDK